MKITEIYDLSIYPKGTIFYGVKKYQVEITNTAYTMNFLITKLTKKTPIVEIEKKDDYLYEILSTPADISNFTLFLTEREAVIYLYTYLNDLESTVTILLDTCNLMIRDLKRSSYMQTHLETYPEDFI